MNRRNAIQKLTGGAIITGLLGTTAAVTNAQDAPTANNGQASKINGASAKSPIAANPQQVPAIKNNKLDFDNKPDPVVEAGKKPLKRDEEKWSTLVETFHKLYGPVPQRNGIKPADIPQGQGVDLKSSVRQLTYDSTLSERFLWNHVELLLNQAADLLERASQMRDQIKDKSAKLASLALEVADFLENDAIHKDEIADGIYTTPYEVSLADENATIQKASGANTFLLFNRSTLQNYYSPAAILNASGRSQLLSWLSFLPNYQYPYVGDALIQTFNGVGLRASDHAIAATADLSYRSAYIEQLALLSQAALQQSASDSANSYLAGALSKRKWDAADIGFKMRRTQAARDIADDKVRLACTPGGAFNYAEQVESCYKRLVRDLVDALSRVSSASQGLSAIYGLDLPVPATTRSILSGGSQNLDLPGFLDDLIDWVRNCIAYLVAFNQRDQGYAYTVSLKRSISKHDWLKGRDAGQWALTFQEEWLPKQLHVRVRGINLFVRGPEGIWRGRITAPKDSFYRHISGKTYPVDQTDMPSVRIGKIDKRSRSYYQEIYGTTTLRNAAPFGAWTIDFEESSSHGESRESIDDIEIDFDIVARSQSREKKQ